MEQTAPVALELGELLIVSLLIVLILISIIGNCLVCIAIFTDRRLRKLGNAFIVSLAIADLFVSCLVMTFALCNDLMNYWIFGAWFCDVWISFDIMCCTASILNLCAISLDRFVHIKDCLLYNQWMTRRVALGAVVIIWFISALVSFVPITLGWHKPGYFSGRHQVSVAANLDLLAVQVNQSGEKVAQVDGFASFNDPLDGRRLANSSQNLDGEHQSALSLASDGNPKRALALLLDGQRRRQNRSTNKSSRSDFVTAASRAMKRLDVQTIGETLKSHRMRRDGLSEASKDNLAQDAQTDASDHSNKQPFDSIDALSKSETPQAIGQLASRPIEMRLEPTSSEGSSPGLEASAQGEKQPRDSASQLPQCMLTLTPTYAIVSSTISFYIPCIIMLGLYIKLFACARRHVRNIQAISKAPMPIGQLPESSPNQSSSSQLAAEAKKSASTRFNRSLDNRSARIWIKFRRRTVARGGQFVAQNATPIQESASRPIKRGDKRQVSVAGSQDDNSNAKGQGDGQDQIGLKSEIQSVEGADVAVRAECERLLGPANATASASAQRTEPEEARVVRQSTSSGGASIKLKLAGQQEGGQQQQYHHVQYQQQQQQQSGQLATHKAAVTLGIIMGTFLFCWVPFFCLNITKAFCLDCIPSSVFRAFTWLGYANSALNPIIYGIHNSEFRNAFNRIFFKHLNIKSSRHYLNRRFSYDLRHPSNRSVSREPKSLYNMTASSPANSKQTNNNNNNCNTSNNNNKSDTIT